MATVDRKFAYYRNLTARQKQIYDRSDAVSNIRFLHAEHFRPHIAALEKALASEDRSNTQQTAQRFIADLCDAFRVTRVAIKVLARRPSQDWGEMHGLYEAEDGTHPVVTVWMRTAKRKQVVAFKTFLRTIIHEFMHHLDYVLLKLEDSLHTRGFYERESNLVKMLLGI